MSDLLGMLGYGLLGPESARLNEQTGGVLGGQFFQPQYMGLATTGGGGQQMIGPTRSAAAALPAGPMSPNFALDPGMGSLHEAQAPLGLSGYLGGGANIMPSMGGFGPMAQLWGAGGAIDSLFRKDVQGDVNTTESMLGNAAQGALAGSYFGPWGAAIGGGIGALGGMK